MTLQLVWVTGDISLLCTQDSSSWSLLSEEYNPVCCKHHLSCVCEKKNSEAITLFQVHFTVLLHYLLFNTELHRGSIFIPNL